jgi:hypothetical protein
VTGHFQSQFQNQPQKNFANAKIGGGGGCALTRLKIAKHMFQFPPQSRFQASLLTIPTSSTGSASVC